jgi:hypothetical protein
MRGADAYPLARCLGAGNIPAGAEQSTRVSPLAQGCNILTGARNRGPSRGCRRQSRKRPRKSGEQSRSCCRPRIWGAGGAPALGAGATGNTPASAGSSYEMTNERWEVTRTSLRARGAIVDEDPVGAGLGNIPLGCGEQREIRAQRARMKGTSPRARGCGRPQLLRPGEPETSPECGEQLPGLDVLGLLGRTSSRVRGAELDAAYPAAVGRNIPGSAGSRYWPVISPCRCREHPRGCAEQSFVTQTRATSGGRPSRCAKQTTRTLDAQPV